MVSHGGDAPAGTPTNDDRELMLQKILPQSTTVWLEYEILDNDPTRVIVRLYKKRRVDGRRRRG